MPFLTIVVYSWQQEHHVQSLEEDVYCASQPQTSLRVLETTLNTGNQWTFKFFIERSGWGGSQNFHPNPKFSPPTQNFHLN